MENLDSAAGDEEQQAHGSDIVPDAPDLRAGMPELPDGGGTLPDGGGSIYYFRH